MYEVKNEVAETNSTQKIKECLCWYRLHRYYVHRYFQCRLYAPTLGYRFKRRKFKINPKWAILVPNA